MTKDRLQLGEIAWIHDPVPQVTVPVEVPIADIAETIRVGIALVRIGDIDAIVAGNVPHLSRRDAGFRACMSSSCCSTGTPQAA